MSLIAPYCWPIIFVNNRTIGLNEPFKTTFSAYEHWFLYSIRISYQCCLDPGYLHGQHCEYNREHNIKTIISPN